MVQINSSNVIIDHTWLWRADHDAGGRVYSSRNYVENGLQVNGDNVIAYGLFSEHSLGDLVQWNGNYGKTYFYQSELPYDVTQSNYADKGYHGYKVGDHVTSHHGYGIGVYSFFRDNSVWMDTAIKAPEARDVHFVNAMTVKLAGNGGIKHIVNNEGWQVDAGHKQNYLCNHNFEEGWYQSISFVDKD